MRILVVGLGGIGQRHVRNLRRLFGDSVEILACRTRGLSRLIDDQLQAVEGDVEAEYGLEVLGDLGEALTRNPDAVLVSNPTSLHIGTALAAAEAGCHLFIEKPLSHSLDRVAELIAVVEQRKLTALVGYQMRFHPCLLALRSLLERKRLGRLLSVRAEVGAYLPGWHEYEDYRQMYAARADLGGGVILSQIHELDYVYWLFGLPKKVFALGGRLDTLDIDVEDTASMLMDCEVDGRSLPVAVHLDYLQRPPTRVCEIVGECGRARLDFDAAALDVIGESGQLVESYRPDGFERNQLFLDEMAHFTACVRGEATPVVPIRQGVESLRMALAARESLATGCAVNL